MDHFVSETPGIMTVIANGPTKSSIKIRPGLNIDLRVVPEESYGAALNYFTGSKEHNVVIRRRANKKGLTLNEYGLFKVGQGSREEARKGGQARGGQKRRRNI